jgi:tRNA threonylcarbamoyladenosine biosynthesis protein TsaE
MSEQIVAWYGRSRSAAQTRHLGEQVARWTRAGDVIALIGELGAGKTQFVGGLARAMGVEQTVASPTFVFMHEYEPPGQGPILVHIDAYRLDGPQHLDSIGWDTATGGAELREQAVVVIEWADRVAAALGPDRLEVHLTHRSDSERNVRMVAGGNWCSRLLTLTDELDTICQGRP